MDKFNQSKYDMQYKKDHYERINLLLPKDKMLKSRLETLAISTNKSKNQLIIEAIEKLLQDNDL